MQKLTRYMLSWCLFLAGTSAVAIALPGQGAAQDAAMPTIPMAPAPAGNDVMPAPPNTAPVPADRSAGTPTAAVGAIAPVAAPCAVEPRRQRCMAHDEVDCTGIKPLGACVRDQICVQVRNGTAAQMVLYHYDFNDPAIGDPAKLNPYGLRRLNQIAKQLQAGHACYVSIEETISNPSIDTARQMFVQALLGESGLAPQIVIGDTPRQLRGDEALIIQGNLLQQTTARGPNFIRQQIGQPGQ